MCALLLGVRSTTPVSVRPSRLPLFRGQRTVASTVFPSLVELGITYVLRSVHSLQCTRPLSLYLPWSYATGFPVPSSYGGPLPCPVPCLPVGPLTVFRCTLVRSRHFWSRLPYLTTCPTVPSTVFGFTTYCIAFRMGVAV